MDGFAGRCAYRLANGSKALGAWCWEQSALGTLAAAGTLVALPVYEPASTLVVPAFAWGVAAWVKGTPTPVAEHPDDEATNDDDFVDEDDELDEYESDVPEAGEKDPTAALWRYVEHVVAAKHSRNLKGVHVSELLDGLQHHGAMTGWETKHLTAHLKSLGLPVRDLNIKANGKQLNRPGIHYQDLTKTLGRTPALPPYLVPDLTPTETPAAPAPAAAR